MTDATRITRIGTVIVPVSDQERALAFYVETLGLEKRLDAPFGPGGRWIEVAPPGAATTIALVQAQTATLGHRQPRHRRRRRRPRDAADRGVDADPEVIRMGAVRPPRFTFRDPDGNRFRMVQRD